jgi:hypothetical protein
MGCALYKSRTTRRYKTMEELKTTLDLARQLVMVSIVFSIFMVLTVAFVRAKIVKG